MPKSVLFVDDEKQILWALRQLFTQEDYVVFTAESGEEALHILNRENVNLVIADMRMPMMDGCQLLRIIRERQPQVLRVILSSYADEKIIFKALQDGTANMHMVKPWDDADFFKTVNQLLETAQTLARKQLLEVFNQINALPTIPVIYNKLCTLIEKDASIEEIAKVIECDQAIAAKVLHLANAAIYSKKSGSIKSAIAYLGLTNLKNIVLLSTLMSSVNKPDNFGFFNKRLMWKHTSQTNKIANLIYSDLLKKRIPDNYLMTGLLHDIGELILMDSMPREYEKVVEAIKTNPKVTFAEAERQILPIDHQEAGGYLLSLWGLPLPIIEAALYHHNPFHENVINREIVAVVHLANHYSWFKINKTISSKLDPEVFEFLKLDKSYCDAFFEKIDLELDEF